MKEEWDKWWRKNRADWYLTNYIHMHRWGNIADRYDRQGVVRRKHKFLAQATKYLKLCGWCNYWRRMTASGPSGDECLCLQYSSKRNSYGCYRRAVRAGFKLLNESHIRIAWSAYHLSPVVRYLLKQTLHKLSLYLYYVYIYILRWSRCN